MKMKIWITTLIIFLLLFGILLTRKHWINLFFNFEPRNPRTEIPVTYNIGWWSQQNKLTIDTFYIKIIESKLNLFNSFSLISYTIKGHLIDSSANWKPEIVKVHISERVTAMDSLYVEILGAFSSVDTIYSNDPISIKPEAIIEITPIVALTKESMNKQKNIPFEITNEHKIESTHWGNNYILFKCGNFESIILLQQSK